MRILLSTIGSRGDVQPLVALALELKALAQEVRLCVPPDFRDWIAGLGLPVTPIGPELRSMSVPKPEQRLQLVERTVATQFATITDAAGGCDMIVGATALQIAAPSVAERMGIPYVFAAYCPTVLPSSHHAPPVLTMRGDSPAPRADDYSARWVEDARRWNETWGSLLNDRRASLGLGPVTDVRRYVLTDSPWLAADPSLAPWPDGGTVFHPGAWILPDARPLSPEVEAFLDGGEPPVYFGFGSIRAPQHLNQTMIASARALGRRAIVSRGWVGLSLVDDAPDCLSVDEVNHQALFTRVAAVVHHGGAGTTSAAARAAAPQVLIPQHYDQFYWAQRVHDLGIGAVAGDALTDALERALQPDVADRARVVAARVRTDGARFAAQRVIARR